MLDFKPQSAKTKRPVEFLTRPQQRKLLLVVMLVGGTVVLGKYLYTSKFWLELFAPPTVTGPVEASIPPQPRYYNTSIRPESGRELPLNTFVAQAEVPAEIDPAAKFFPGIKPKLLGAIRDFTPFRPAENPAWLNVLNVLKEHDENKLKQASTGAVGFVQLYEQMNIYRGQLVTVRGVVKRAFDVHAVKNDFGIEKYYQLWLFPEGGPISPIVIYSLELPPGFPMSRDKDDKVVNIDENVTLTGVAFKNWVYGTEQRIESAPLLLAKSFSWHKQVVVAEEPTSPWLIASVIGGTALVALLFTAYVMISSNKLGAKNNKMLAHFSAASTAAHPQSNAEVGQTLAELAAQSDTEPNFPSHRTPDETSP